MPDAHYVYLMKRLATEQDRALNTTCRQAAAVHQSLADAYARRLQALPDLAERREGGADVASTWIGQC